MDTMEINKIVGAVCGALLVYLGVNFFAEQIFHGGGHGGEHEYAYALEIEEEGGEAEEEEEVDFATLLASADPGKGERVFGKCRACHKLEDGANATGPHLYDVVGRDIGAAEGFSYSGALSEQGDVWSPDNLNAFLENPSGWAPGTSMSFAGLRDVEDRAQLIAYLQTIGE